MPDEPTTGELVRRLDDVVRAHERTVTRLEKLADTLEEKYVTRREHDELKKDVESQSAFRRQVAAGFLVGLLLLVANVLVTLSMAPGAGA